MVDTTVINNQEDGSLILLPIPDKDVSQPRVLATFSASKYGEHEFLVACREGNLVAVEFYLGQPGLT